MNMKQTLGTAIALTLSMTGAANAFSVNTGFGNIGGLDGFDWAPNSALGQKSLPLSAGGTKFNVFSQASLSSYIGGNNTVSDNNLNKKYEVTYEVGFGEIGYLTGSVPGVLANAYFTFDPSTTVNFFNVYYDTAVNANALEGTGYNDGDLILSGLVVAGNGVQNTYGTYTILFGAPLAKLDSNGADNWGGKQTYQGSGANKAVIDLNAQNQEYAFFNGLDLDGLTTLTILDSLATTPFNQVDPSKVVAGQTAILPTINGDLTCSGTNVPCDFLFQNDGSQKFSTKVPEPDMVALLGLGLLGMGAAARRKHSA